MEILLPVPVRTVLNQLEQNGYEAYVVGGCVRDSLLSREPGDWDVCTDALPDEIKVCFEGHKTIDTGLMFGTVTVKIDAMDIEITTYRIDTRYSDYRRPDQVLFTDNLQMDCRRRDFTINAMAYNPKTGIKDFFGGLTDLKAKRIRSVGDADERFTEDALRILRALRFSSVLSYSIEENTALCIHANKHLLRKISSERIAAELNKLLLGDLVQNVLTDFADVFAVIIPEVSDTVRFKRHGSSIWEHTALSVSNGPKDIAIRLALLFHEISPPVYQDKNLQSVCKSAKSALRTLEYLKYDRNTIKKTVTLVENQTMEPLSDRVNILKQFKRYQPEIYLNLLDVKEACLQAQEIEEFDKLRNVWACRKTAHEILQGNYCWSVSRLAVNGVDLMNAGMVQGIKLGKVLDLLVDHVIDGRVENKKEVLLEYALNLYQQDLSSNRP